MLSTKQMLLNLRFLVLEVTYFPHLLHPFHLCFPRFHQFAFFSPSRHWRHMIISFTLIDCSHYSGCGFYGSRSESACAAESACLCLVSNGDVSRFYRKLKKKRKRRKRKKRIGKRKKQNERGGVHEDWKRKKNRKKKKKKTNKTEKNRRKKRRTKKSNIKNQEKLLKDFTTAKRRNSGFQW